MKSFFINFFICLFGLFFLGCCSFGIPLKKPEIVERQEALSGTLRVGESSTADVRAALGKPLLQSSYWNLDVFQTEDMQKDLAFFMFFTPPVPLGVFTTKVSGYVLVTYDNYGRVSNVASGVTSKMFGEKEGLMLKEGDLNFVIEKFGPRGLQLIIQSTRLLEYLELNGDAPECTFVLACERQITMQAQGWYETCPDRVVIDAGEPFNLQPLLTECTPDTCPDTIVPIGSGHVLVPLLYPVVLPAGRHQLELSSSIYKGQSKSVFECEQGQVLYGTIHGSLTKHWWSPRYSTINTFVSFSVIPPSDLKSYSALLYSNNHWLIGQKPLKITK